MIERQLRNTILSRWDSGKVLIILGARQVGKTTLIQSICESMGDYLYLTGDDIPTRLQLENIGLAQLQQIIQQHPTIFIDEAQRIPNIGIIAKLIHDHIKGVRIILSGSSSLELLSSINEPLTGRKWEYHLYPISFTEIKNHFGYLHAIQSLENYLIYGSYPDVLNHPGDEQGILKQLSGSYLYKDLLDYQGIRRPEILSKLLVALSLQVGAEVSYNELSHLLQADRLTIETYISLLEQAFVIFRLSSFSRNMRNEIKSGRKIYFFDNGVRNALINNFNPIALRTDIGALWENFLISERVKRNSYQQLFHNRYFWRTHAKQEIDYIEEYNGHIYAYEFKWSGKKQTRLPESFSAAYPNTSFQTITKDNFLEFVDA